MYSFVHRIGRDLSELKGIQESLTELLEWIGENTTTAYIHVSTDADGETIYFDRLVAHPTGQITAYLWIELVIEFSSHVDAVAYKLRWG